ncbi:MAG TPA: hypothetical protein ENH82_02145 [bacterium]|nr:hypothetical protein [bacterium]
MNKCAIIACGPTAKFFHGGCDSIGVNDAWKFYRTKYLLVTDPKRNFRNEGRLDYILKCTPEVFYYYYKCGEWKDANNSEVYHAIKWQGHLDPNKIYTSMSTPFVATSMAIHLGYEEIIIYGADYYNHKNFNPDTRATRGRFDDELRNFKELALEALRIGVTVYCGHRASALSEVMKVKR